MAVAPRALCPGARPGEGKAAADGRQAAQQPPGGVGRGRGRHVWTEPVL
jgi:hypothetical protein